MMGMMTCDQKYRSICRFPYQMTIYDSKEDVIETIFLQFGFLSLGLLMITENLIASGFVWQSSNAVSLSLPSAMIWCLLLHISLNFIITERSQEVGEGVSYPNSTGLAETLFRLFFWNLFVQHLTCLPLTWKYSALECQPSPALVSVQCPMSLCGF